MLFRSLPLDSKCLRVGVARYIGTQGARTPKKKLRTRRCQGLRQFSDVQAFVFCVLPRAYPAIVVNATRIGRHRAARMHACTFEPERQARTVGFRRPRRNAPGIRGRAALARHVVHGQVLRRWLSLRNGGAQLCESPVSQLRPARYLVAFPRTGLIQICEERLQ